MGAMRATPFLRRVLLVGSLAFTTALSAQSVIFWAQNGNDRVLRADGNGASVTDLTPTLSNPWGVAYDGTHVYFSEDNAGKLWRMDPDGNNRTEIANGLSMPRDVAVSSTNLYWVNISGGVFRSNLDGTGVTTLTTVAGSPFLQGVDVTDNYLYWTNATAHTIQRSNLDGTNVITLTSAGGNIPYGIDATATFLYWVNLTGRQVQRANLDGTGVTTLIDSIDLVGAPSGLFVTDTAIYFTQQYHGVYRANLDGSGLTQLVTGSSDYRFIDGQVLAVPEPSTYALLAGGLALGLAAWRRRGGV
jgi:uncharacterized protein YjbI with pentapeptide repeats